MEECGRSLGIGHNGRPPTVMGDKCGRSVAVVGHDQAYRMHRTTRRHESTRVCGVASILAG